MKCSFPPINLWVHLTFPKSDYLPHLGTSYNFTHFSMSPAVDLVTCYACDSFTLFLQNKSPCTLISSGEENEIPSSSFLGTVSKTFNKMCSPKRTTGKWLKCPFQPTLHSFCLFFFIHPGYVAVQPLDLWPSVEELTRLWWARSNPYI